MECDRAAPWLPLLLDRRLPVWRRLRLARHVASCAACAARLDELQHIHAAMKTNLPYHRAPPGLAARIVSALPREVGAGAGAAVVPSSRLCPGGHWPDRCAGRRGSGAAGAGGRRPRRRPEHDGGGDRQPHQLADGEPPD